MQMKFTEEQLNNIDKSLLVQMFLNMQDQLEMLTKETHALNEKMQLMMEQLILSKNNRFGRSSEKMQDTNQISFMEVDGMIVFFNEAEAECNLDMEEPDDLEIKPARKNQRMVFFQNESHATCDNDEAGSVGDGKVAECFVFQRYVDECF